MNKRVETEESPDYVVTPSQTEKQKIAEDNLIQQALYILKQRLRDVSDLQEFTEPNDARRFCSLMLAELEHEVFGALFLDTRHKLIQYVELFRGTIDGATVHPREVVKEALKLNAAAVIFTHNHPSGVTQPSRADEQLTRRLKDALATIDIRVIDHIIVGGVETASFAERGLI